MTSGSCSLLNFIIHDFPLEALACLHGSERVRGEESKATVKRKLEGDSPLCQKSPKTKRNNSDRPRHTHTKTIPWFQPYLKRGGDTRFAKAFRHGMRPRAQTKVAPRLEGRARDQAKRNTHTAHEVSKRPQSSIHCAIVSTAAVSFAWLARSLWPQSL